MKILAIRGCNLASLAGEFEIDLARGSLGGAGVFAIVGNTGAGKTTLLDALCVALFDRTPRLTNHSTVKVGRGEERALLGEPRLDVRRDRQPRIDLRAGHALEQLAAILAVGAHERRELALSEQCGSPELIEGEAEALRDRLQRLGLRAAEPFAPVERG